MDINDLILREEQKQLERLLTELTVTCGALAMVLSENGLIPDEKYWLRIHSRASFQIDQLKAEAKEEIISEMDSQERESYDFFQKFIKDWT